MNEFKGIQSGNTIAWFMKWSDISLAILGIIGWYALSSQTDGQHPPSKAPSCHSRAGGNPVSIAARLLA